jgi:hypothetical protein
MPGNIGKADVEERYVWWVLDDVGERIDCAMENANSMAHQLQQGLHGFACIDIVVHDHDVQ